MTNFYPPKVNMNGDTYETLEAQLEAVCDAADDLQKALSNAAPHERNYQTMSDEKYYNNAREWLYHQKVNVGYIKNTMTVTRILLRKENK